jgi:hypothetical protein
VSTWHFARLCLCLVCVVISASSSACRSEQNDRTARVLQSKLATLVVDPVCPSGDSKDIQHVIDVAGVDGVASIPAGCYKITSTIYLPPCIQLIGAGANKTILYRDPEGNYARPIITLNGRKGTSCTTQVSGIAFLGVRDTEDTGKDYGVSITSVNDFRIDHCYFEGFGFAGVNVEGNSSGVIDHAIFIDNFKRGINTLGYGVVVYGTDRWNAELQPGGKEATFVEDSIFSGNRHAIASSAGAHYVFRNNQVMRGVEACGIDAHGMGYSSAHGTQYVEIYHNTISDPVYNWCGIGIRGGAGVVFENTVQGYKNPILLILEWGTPDRYKSEYPALDQIQDLYVWDNQVEGEPTEPRVDETGKGFIELNRDYYTAAKPGYVPYQYPHPLASGGPFDQTPWPPADE